MKIKKPGFTLLELVIVMAIITIMTIIALSNIQSNKKSKELEAAARAVSAAIREAQNNALAGKQVTADMYPCNYQIRTSSISTRFLIRYNDHFLGSSCGSFNNYITYDLKNNVEIQVPAVNINIITYSVPFGVVSPSLSPNPFPIRICKVGATRNDTNCYTVCVNNEGNVWEKPNCGADTCIC